MSKITQWLCGLGKNHTQVSGIMVQVWFCFKFSLVLGLPSITSALESFEEMSVTVILSMASSASPPPFLRPQIRSQKQFLKWLMGPTRDIWGSTQPQLPVSSFKVASVLLDSPQRVTYWANWPEEESQEEVFRVSLAYSKALRSCGLKPSSHLPGHVGEWPCVSAGPQNLPPFFMWFCSFSLHSQLWPTDSPKVPPVLLYMRWASLYGIRYIPFLGKSCPSAQDSSEQTFFWSPAPINGNSIGLADQANTLQS